MPILFASFSNQKLKLPDKLKLKIVFSSASMSTTNCLPSFIVGLYFPLLFITETSIAAKGHLKIPVTTATYGKGAFISMATKTWNNT